MYVCIIYLPVHCVGWLRVWWFRSIRGRWTTCTPCSHSWWLSNCSEPILGKEECKIKGTSTYMNKNLLIIMFAVAIVHQRWMYVCMYASLLRNALRMFKRIRLYKCDNMWCTYCTSISNNRMYICMYVCIWKEVLWPQIRWAVCRGEWVVWVWWSGARWTPPGPPCWRNQWTLTSWSYPFRGDYW